MTVGVTAIIALTVNGPFLALVGHLSDHLSERSVELLFGIGAVGMVLASLGTTALSRRMGDGRALAAGLVLHGLAVAVFVVRSDLTGALGLFILAFAGYQMASVAFGSRRSTWAAGKDAGAAIGGASALAGVAVFLVLSLAGALEGPLGRGAPLLRRQPWPLPPPWSPCGPIRPTRAERAGMWVPRRTPPSRARDRAPNASAVSAAGMSPVR